MSKDSKVLIIICLAVVAVMAGIFILLGGKTEQQSSVLNPAVLVRQDSYSVGDGAIAIVEFADFECPACQVAAPELLKLKAEHGDKVKVVFRHFPLPTHRYSRISAQAAEAAGEQGKFWEMYELLYLKQAEWSKSSRPLEQFNSYASQLGLDVGKFSLAVSANKFNQKIERDLEDAASLGVNSTPTVYVDGKKLAGFPSFEALSSAIGDAVKK